jgi:hypothetical protein
VPGAAAAVLFAVPQHKRQDPGGKSARRQQARRAVAAAEAEAADEAAEREAETAAERAAAAERGWDLMAQLLHCELECRIGAFRTRRACLVGPETSHVWS